MKSCPKGSLLWLPESPHSLDSHKNCNKSGNMGPCTAWSLCLESLLRLVPVIIEHLFTLAGWVALSHSSGYKSSSLLPVSGE